MTMTPMSQAPSAPQSVDRQTSIPGSEPFPPPDLPFKRKRGRPPKHLAQPAADGIEAKRLALRKLDLEREALKTQIAAEEKRRVVRQAEIVGKVVIAAVATNENVARVVRVLLTKALLSSADKTDIAPLLNPPPASPEGGDK